MKPRTLLIYPDLAYSDFQRPAPPYSVLFIADALQQAGVEVSVFDLRYDRISDVLESVTEQTPEYVGISVMTGPQIRNALTVAASVREVSPEIRLVWGGIHPTILPFQTIRHPLVDIVIRGDGETPYAQLVKSDSWQSIQGLVYQHNDQIHDGGLAPHTDMATVHIPWDLVDAKRYVEHGRTSVITSRGCPYRCAFCYNAQLHAPWRGWTANQCIIELAPLIACGAEDLLFFDDAFFTNLARIRKLFPYFRKENLTWTAELRIDQLTKELARDSKEAGCKCLFFGAESGSLRILRLLNKRITVQQQLRSAKITNEIGLGADYSWMIAIPTETPKDRRLTISTIKAIQRINPTAEFSIKIYTPYPGTPLYKMAVTEGARLPESLTGWANFSRYRAGSHLAKRRHLETLTLTSAIIGRHVFQKMHGPPAAFIRWLAGLRWRNEYFGLPWESFLYTFLSDHVEQTQPSKTKHIMHGLAGTLFQSNQKETFAR
jgi:radical SAM superfamily enzyme YgiQ (UPF0313 family)